MCPHDRALKHGAVAHTSWLHGHHTQDNIDPVIIEQLQPLLKHTDFQPAKIKKVSQAAFGLCNWVRAMDTYDRVAKVGPGQSDCGVLALQRVLHHHHLPFNPAPDRSRPGRLRGGVLELQHVSWRASSPAMQACSCMLLSPHPPPPLQPAPPARCCHGNFTVPTTATSTPPPSPPRSPTPQVVRPKKAALAEAQVRLQEVMAALKLKQEELAGVGAGGGREAWV